MRTTRRTTATVVAVLAVAALTGCATTTSQAGGTATAAAALEATSAPTPTPTPTQVTPTAVGVSLDAAAAANLAPGWKAYPLADGTKVAVSAAAPLPDVVRGQAIAPVTAAIDALPRGAGTTEAQINAVAGIEATVDRAAYAIGQATGKRVVIVFNSHGGVPALGGREGTIWESSARGAIATVATYNRDAAVADTQAWIAKQATPANYELFVVGW